MRKHVFQPLAEADVVRFVRGCKRVEDRQPLPAGFVSGEQTVFPNNSDTSIEAFRRVIVDVELGIVQKLFQFRFDIQRIVDRFRHQRRRSFGVSKCLGLHKKLGNQLLRHSTCRFPLLKKSSLRPFFLSTSLCIVLNLIKIPHEFQKRLDFPIAVVKGINQIASVMSFFLMGKRVFYLDRRKI